MLPYLIAGAIGFAVAKLFEEDETPKYSDGGYIKNIKKLYEEDGSEVYGGDFGEAGGLNWRINKEQDYLYLMGIGRNKKTGSNEGESKGEGSRAIAYLFNLYPKVDVIYFEIDGEEGAWQFYKKIGAEEEGGGEIAEHTYNAQITRESIKKYFKNKDISFSFNYGGKLADNIFDYFIEIKGLKPLGNQLWEKSNCTIKMDFSNVLNLDKHNRVWLSPIEYNDYKKAFTILEFHCRDKNKGVGTSVLKEIIQGADLFGYTIFIEPTSMKKYRVETDINTDDLKRWYSKYDFKPINDNYSDYVWLRSPKNPNIRLDDGGIVQPKDLTKINNFKNIQIGVDYYAYSDDIEKQNKSDRWYELFVKNQKHKKITPKEFKEFISLSNELAWEDLGDSNSDGYKSGGSVNVIDVKQYNIGRRNYRFVEIAQKNNNKIELYRQADDGKYYGSLLYREVPRYTPQFESTMVNDLNQLYAYEPVSEIELLNAVINKTKPFASLVYFVSDYEESEVEKEIAGYISKCEKYDLDYSVNRINGEDGLDRIAFAVCHKGTFDELFDIDALLGDYFTNDFDLFYVKKIIEFRDKELSHFLNNDWDDNYALTGLILGIPPKFTMSLLNMGSTYGLGKEYKYDNEVVIIN